MRRQLTVATIFVCIATSLFSAVYAQSCPPPSPPPISLQNAEICAGASDHAWTTSGFASYVWSATHGSIVTSDSSGNVTFSADGTGDVALSVTATDANGCANTNSVTVPLHTITAPAIMTQYGDMCATGWNYATVAPPAPSGPGWMSISWTISHGTINSGGSSSSVSFNADNSGQPVGLTVDVIDEQGCTAQSSVTIPIRTISTPAITLWDSTMCAQQYNSATVAPPAPSGPGWQSIAWTIQNGVIPGPSNGSQVSFTSDGSGQTVVLSVVVQDENGCTAQNSASISIRTIPSPVITVYDADSPLCPNVQGYASIPSNPTNGLPWRQITWTIEHGNINSGVTNARDVYFTADGSGETIVLHVSAVSDDGCPATATATKAARIMPPPAIQVQNASMCADASNHATVDGPPGGGSWGYIYWSIEHGTITSYGWNSPNVSFMSDGSGLPVVLYAYVSEQYTNCNATATVTIPINAPPAPPEIHLYTNDICPTGGYDQAWVDNPASGYWSSIQWTVEHGTITSGSNNQSIYFWADGSGLPPVVRVWVQNDSGCSVTNETTVAIRSIPAPEIHLYTADVCPTGGYDQAWVDNPASGYWSSIQWTVEHGTITSGANSQSMYFWADGSGLPPVVHVQVQDDRSCIANNSATVAIRTIPAPEVHLYTNDICPTGGYDQAWVDNPASGYWSSIQWTVEHGTITSGANNQSMYFWSDGSGLAPVVHVQVQDDRSCIANNSATVAIRTIPAPEVHLYTNDICPTGGYDQAWVDNPAGGYWSSIQWTVEHGTITSGANNQSMYFWSDGSGLAPVVHVQVQDDRSCIANNSATVAIRTIETPTITASGPLNFCAGGSVTLTASSAASYLWSNGATTQSITVNATGNYSVEVTDASGCGATSAAAAVTVNPLPTPSITFDKPDFCPESNITASVPAGYVSYSWSVSAGSVSGQGTNSIFIQIPGTTPLTVSVTVTDANGCSATTSATLPVRNFPKPVVNIDVTQVCPGGMAHATVSNGPYTAYYWTVQNGTIVSGDGTSQITFTPNGGGLMTVHVLAGGSDNCASISDDVSVAVNTPVTPAITASGNTTFCLGGSVTLTSSTANAYLWSTGETSQSITVSAGGSYSVTTTDANGCTATSNPTVVTVDPALAKPTATPPGPTSICPGGSVTMTASETGGSGSYSYQWYGITGAIAGATSQTYTVSPASNAYYYVIVTDSIGCVSTNSDAVVVTVNPAPDATITANTGVCAGATSSASVADAGVGATYSWTVTGGTLEYTMANGAAAFFHSDAGANSVVLNVTVTTSAGCSATSQKTVAVNPLPNATISTSGPTTFCAGGSVTLTAPAGMSVYAWSDGSNGSSLTVTTPGAYHVTVTDANGCTATSGDVTVTVNSGPAPSITAPSAICSGASGNASTGAVSGASYAWTISGGTITSGNGTNAITFTSTTGPVSLGVTVTNSNGCNGTASANVTVNPLPDTTITPNGSTTFCDGGSVTLTAPAGMSVYSWNNGGTGRSITVSTTGAYHVTVTDANGCTATSGDVTVTVNSNPAPSITAPAAICSGASGNASTAAVSGASYAWTISGGTITSGNGTNAITFTSANGPVSLGVTVSNSNGCNGTASANVTVNPLPDTTITPNRSTTFCDGGSVTLTAPAGMSVYSWNNGGTGRSITVGTTGAYHVTVTDANGCTATSGDVNVTVNSNPAPSITAPSAICSGASGNASIAAVSGANYAWTISGGTITSGSGTNAITFTSATGPVSLGVTVSNSNGCNGTASASVAVNAVPDATITAPSAFCSGTSAAASVAAVSGGSYNWTISGGTISSGNGTSSITFTSTSGPVSLGVTVTNAAGCSAVSSKSVSVNALPNATITAPSAICSGTTGTASVAAVSGGSYAWTISGGSITGGSGTNTITFTSMTGPVSLGVTVTTANGCSATGNASVAVNANPATPTITPNGATTFCAGGSVTLTATAAASYHWSTGETTQSIVVTTGGQYTVWVTNASGCASASSAPVTVTVNATTITQQPASTTIPHNNTVTLTVSATGTGTLHYQWYNPPTANNNDTSRRVGADSATYKTPKLATGTYYYYVVVTGSCGSVRSSIATITSN